MMDRDQEQEGNVREKPAGDSRAITTSAKFSPPIAACASDTVPADSSAPEDMLHLANRSTPPTATARLPTQHLRAASDSAIPAPDHSPGEHDDAAPRWRPVPRHRAYQQVVVRIEEQILAGTLVVGDRLPAERDLAAMLGVSRAAVREANRTLEAQGVLRASVGVGPEGGTIVCAMPSEALSRMLRLHVALSNFPTPDVIEARVMLERWSARLAARARPPAEVALLLELVGNMEDPASDRTTFNEYDTRFHVAIARAGGNALVSDMTSAIRESMKLPILESMQAMPAWDDFVQHLRTGHRAIADAISAGDEQGAADAVEEHIRLAYSALNYGHPRAD